MRGSARPLPDEVLLLPFRSGSGAVIRSTVSNLVLAAVLVTLAGCQYPLVLVVSNNFHTLDYELGGGVQPQPGGGSFRYPPEGFVHGRIAGHRVPCISADVQVRCHLGYETTAKDAHDVLLLCRHFDLHVPPAYRTFSGQGAA